MFDHLGHDLFLLMLNLSQLRDPELTVELFVEGMNALQNRVRLRALKTDEIAQAEVVPVATRRNQFGRIVLERSITPQLDTDRLEVLPLVRNAIKMLAVILENQKQAHLLADENLLLESLVQQRTADLAASEERFRLVSELVSDFAYSVRLFPDHTIKIEWITEAFAQLTGYTLDEAGALGKLEVIVFPDDRALVSQRMERLLAGQEVITEYRMLTRDGGFRWVRDYGRPVPDGLDDGSLRVIGGAQDITERKQAEAKLVEYQEHLEVLVDARTAELRQRTAELVAANQELRELTKVKDEFVANVSHELRTPITNLVLREHLMRRQPDEWQRHLVVIERETERLARTINDLLLLSRMDRDRVDLHTEPIDLNTLARQYVFDRESIATDQGLTLTLHPLDDVPPVRADSGLLGQALSILLTNAFNYTPPGEHVSVRVDKRHVNGQRWAGITVSDTGLGIHKDDQSRLFERFFRGGAARTSGAPGTGLGLSILQGIVDRHGGEVEVESSGIPGEGARFTIWLPVIESRLWDRVDAVG